MATLSWKEYAHYKIIDDGDVSADITSDIIHLAGDGRVKRVSVEILTVPHAGDAPIPTHDGVLYCDLGNSGDNWGQQPDVEQIIAPGAVVAVLKDDFSTAAAKLRFRYARSAGRGTLSVWINICTE